MVSAPPAWPAPEARLTPLAAPEMPPGEPFRLVIDAGHGEPGNLGNRSALCEREATFTLRTQEAVIQRLRQRPGLALSAGRPRGVLIPYTERITTFDAWADAVVSVHSDARAVEGIGADPATGCLSGHGANGFSVLWSDEGDAALVARRHHLATAVATRMAQAGFPAYDGGDYPGLYEADPQVPGVFVDRHTPARRIRMLRRTHVPLVIVETHQALDPDEAARWNEPETLDAFASALFSAAVDVRR